MESVEQQFSGKKVGILGYGVEGKAALRYFQAQGADVTILDERETISDPPSGVEAVLGAGAFDDLSGFDLVSRTPPLRPDRLQTAREVTSVTNEFFRRCPAPIIAVTGTKGKGTTTTLIARILEKAGHRVHTVGNIGQPGLDVLDDIQPDDIVCYEISSFQLWDIKQSPRVAVVLMVVEDHQDVHSSLDEYVEAKGNIGRFQSADDVLVVHPDNALSQRIASYSAAQKREYFTSSGAHIRGEDIIINEQKICATNEVGLLGAHNLENICAAITAAWEYTQDVAAIAGAVKEFKGLPHRLEFVAEKNGVSYYDDSFSASPLAAVSATRVFGEKAVMIYGGKDKGIDYQLIVEAAIEQNVAQAILIGEVGAILEDRFKQSDFKRYQMIDGSMEDIVRVCSEYAKPGMSVVLSPGSSSFDMFENYKERGQLFAEAVKKL